MSQKMPCGEIAGKKQDACRQHKSARAHGLRRGRKAKRQKRWRVNQQHQRCRVEIGATRVCGQCREAHAAAPKMPAMRTRADIARSQPFKISATVGAK